MGLSLCLIFQGSELFAAGTPHSCSSSRFSSIMCNSAHARDSAQSNASARAQLSVGYHCPSLGKREQWQAGTLLLYMQSEGNGLYSSLGC